jgi:hypothetical protein
VSDDGKVYGGQPVDNEMDGKYTRNSGLSQGPYKSRHLLTCLVSTVGLALKEGKEVKARVLSSSSALDQHAEFTGEQLVLKEVSHRRRNFKADIDIDLEIRSCLLCPRTKSVPSDVSASITTTTA